MIQIRRTQKPDKYLYTSSHPNTESHAGYTYGVTLRSVRVKIDDTQYSMKESSRLIKMMAWLPVISWYNPYTVYKDGTMIGEIEKQVFKPIFHLETGDGTYEFSMHSGSVTSVMKNNVQIAVIKKNPTTVMEKTEYCIFHSPCEVSDSAYLHLFCILIDLTYYRIRGKVDGYKTEKEYVLNDPHKERARWLPPKV